MSPPLLNLLSARALSNSTRACATSKNKTKKTLRLLSDNANKPAGQSGENGRRESDDSMIGGGGDRLGRARGGASREEERRRSLDLRSELPTPYLVATNLPADVTREELFQAFR